MVAPGAPPLDVQSMDTGSLEYVRQRGFLPAGGSCSCCFHFLSVAGADARVSVGRRVGGGGGGGYMGVYA